MIPIVVGLESGADRTPVHDEIQDAFWRIGMGVYYPQAAGLGYPSYNLAQQWDCDRQALDWMADAVVEAERFLNPMVGHFPKYFWGDRVDGQKSPNPGAYAFCGIGQDRLALEELTAYLRLMRNWLIAHEITEPWYMVDEPPNPANPAFSDTVVARITKFVTAAVNAGWTVGVCYATPQAHDFWKDILPAQRVILNAKYSRTDYGATRAGEVWLYNRRGSFDGLAEQLREFRASGYLHWSAAWDELPLVEINDETWTMTDNLDELMRQIALFEADADEPEAADNAVYQIMLSNAASHFQAANGLQAIPVWARRAELQLEFCATEADSNGERFAPVGAPGPWLEAAGVDVWYYVNPTAPVLLATQSAVQAERDAQSDPFWWRIRQANAIISNDWWLRDGRGQLVIGSGRNRPVPDIGHEVYVDWLADAIVQTGVRRVRLDDFNPHQHAFHRPYVAAGQDGGDSFLLAGMMRLCDALRADGIEVVANGGWEMSNPILDADSWRYPLIDHVDGVVIELTHDPATGRCATGFARWDGGKFWTMQGNDVWRVVDDWVAAGKTVILDVVWRGGEVDFEAFATGWYELAAAHGALFSTARNVRHQVDTFPLPAANEPEDTDDAEEPQADMAALAEELLAASLDVAAAMALLERAKLRMKAAMAMMTPGGDDAG